MPHKTEYMCFNQRGNISTLYGSSLKLVDKFTYLGKAWTAIDRLSVNWRSDQTDKIKCSFFQSVVMSILLYGCTTWTLTKYMEKELDNNYTRTLWAILNNSRRQHPTKQQLYGHLPPIMKTIQLDEPDMRDTAGEVGMNSQATYSCGPLHMGEQRQDDQLEPIYSSFVPIQDVALKTYQEQWTIETSDGRGSGRSVLVTWH